MNPNELPSPTVAIVDDHPLTTEGLLTRLEAAGLLVLACVAAVEYVPFELSPDVVVCDMRLPGRSGASAIGFLSERGVRILAMSGVATAGEVLDSLVAGASSFVPKTAASPTFVAAVRSVAAGSRYLTAEVAHYLRVDAEHRPLERDDLSPAGLSVLRGLERGSTPGEVAADLRLSSGAFEDQLRAIWTISARRRRRFAPSRREIELLRLTAEGLTHKELAKRLNVSVRTIPDFLTSIKTKYVASHPDVDPTAPPLGLARRWAVELGLS